MLLWSALYTGQNREQGCPFASPMTGGRLASSTLRDCSPIVTDRPSLAVFDIEAAVP